MPVKLRDYQIEMLDSIRRAFGQHQTVLVSAPTGTGKTVIFSELVRENAPFRSLIVVHRDELVWQAKRAVESAGVAAVDIEMAQLRADRSLFGRATCVITTVQTQNARNRDGIERMRAFDPSDFSLIIIDEAHHATAPSWLKVIDHFKQNPRTRILGVTATPFRSDKQPLRNIFETIAYCYELKQAINDGWLVPPYQRFVEIAGLDFSHIRTTAGDLNGAELALVMEQERNLHGVAAATLALVGARQTIVFCASVQQAELLADIFNRHKPGCADFVCQYTPKEKRRFVIDQFRAGQLQIVTNVDVYGEGTDVPNCDAIVMARPTKSLLRYTQMIGRALRPLPGVVDSYTTPIERRDAIARSAKPNCLVLDFVGNSGRHKLVNVLDLFLTAEEERVRARVYKRILKTNAAADALAEIEAERERIRAEAEARRKRELARRARLVATAKYYTKAIDPFDISAFYPFLARPEFKRRNPASVRQQLFLRRLGIESSRLTYDQAQALIREFFVRKQRKLCTLRQALFLVKCGVPFEQTRNMTVEQASEMISKLKLNNGALDFSQYGQ